MLLNMNFSNLSVEGYTTFILALIFTIISISAFIYFARHKNLNKTLSILITLVAPCLAVFFWVYMLMVVLNYSVVISLCSALACAVGYVGIAIGVAFLIMHCIKTKANKPQKVKIEKVEKNDDVEEDEEEDEEVPAFTPVLLVEDKKSKRKKKQPDVEVIDVEENKNEEKTDDEK